MTTPASAPAADALISVCHVVSGDRWAGAEVQVAGLLRKLADRAEIRVSAILLNPGRLADELAGAGIPLEIIPEASNNIFQVASRARAILRERRPHILHSHRYKENLLAAWLARRGCARFVVRTQHGLPEPFRGRRAAKQGLVHTLDGYVARHGTDRFIAVTEDIRKHWAARLPADRLVTIHNGIELERVRARFSRVDARRMLELDSNDFVIGAATRLEPVKRIDLFLRTAREIVQVRPGAKFLIAGEGAESERLRELCGSLGIAERVRFLGHRDDIYDVLQTMDVLLLTSDHEGLPTALLEAMWLGVSIVARRVGGIPEVIENGVHGTLLDSDDTVRLALACLALADDRDYSRRMAAQARQHVAEHFSMQSTADSVARLYASLVR